MSATTAAKPLPTPEQLKAYADQLPEIYRHVLTAFSTANPSRLAGEGLFAGTLATHVVNRGGRFQPEEITLALYQLDDAGFLTTEVGGFDFYTPTPVGEELIAALTGWRAKRVTVPELPKPTW